MAPAHAPPTRILSSTPLSSAQAHAFLTSFTASAGATKNGVHGHNEIVLTNLKRIEQALIGIHVPRPVQGGLDIEALTDMTAPIVEQVVPVEGEGEEQENREGNGGKDIDALREGERERERERDREREGEGEGEGEGEVRNTVIPAVQVGKADRKADKKARRKEEKKQRAEQRKKEKERGSE